MTPESLCPSCDEPGCDEKEVEESFLYGKALYTITIPVVECSMCDLMWTDDRAYEIRAKTILEGKMKGETTH